MKPMERHHHRGCRGVTVPEALLWASILAFAAILLSRFIAKPVAIRALMASEDQQSAPALALNKVITDVQSAQMATFPWSIIPTTGTTSLPWFLKPDLASGKGTYVQYLYQPKTGTTKGSLLRYANSAPSVTGATQTVVLTDIRQAAGDPAIFQQTTSTSGILGITIIYQPSGSLLSAKTLNATRIVRRARPRS
jgi:hypothetical protein